MKISIIVPCYQSEVFLPECLASLLTQDFQGFEVICVNDGSTDGTAGILKEAAQDTRLHVYTTENQGAGAARALGLTKARGDYVLFVDADDVLLPGALQTLYHEAYERKVDIVSADHEIWLPDGTKKRVTLPKEGIETEDILCSLVRLEGLYNNQCNKLIYRALFTKHGIAPIEGVKLGEDVLLNMQLYNAAQGVAHLREVTYLYRKHEGAATARHSLFYDDHVPMLKEMHTWLQEAGWWEKLWPDFFYVTLLLLRKQYGFWVAFRRYGQVIYPWAKDAPPGETEEARMIRCLVRWHVFRIWYLFTYAPGRLQRGLARRFHRTDGEKRRRSYATVKRGAVRTRRHRKPRL